MPDNMVVRRELERYYAVLRDELTRVRLTEGEASLIVDAMNGSITDHYSYNLLWANISDAISLDGLDAKWQVDGAALVEKLRSLTPGAAMAVSDACERFWQDPNPTGEALRRVGLVR